MIEWAWTLIALSGVLMQGWLTHDSLGTLRAAKLAGNGARLRIARGHLRAGAAFLFIHLSFVAAGIRAIATPDDEVPMTFGRAVTIALFMIAAVLLVVIGWFDRRDRLALRTAGTNAVEVDL